MSRETEKAMRELMKYIEDNRSENADKAEIEKLAQQYMDQQHMFDEMEDEPLCAYDYLELAEEAGTKKKRLEYLTKALELEPDNLDAALMMAEEKSKDTHEYLTALAALIEKGDKLMAKEGFLHTGKGEFWHIFETRPYMRVRQAYFHALIECGMMRVAVAEGGKMLELCESDNLGARFQLMHVYAFLEEERATKKLFKKYGEVNSSMLLLPMAVLYYKLNKPDISAEYLNRLTESNKDTKKFFSAVKSGKLEKHVESMSPYGYRPYTMDELLLSVAENEFLYVTVPEFFTWADMILKKKDSKKPTLEVEK